MAAAVDDDESNDDFLDTMFAFAKESEPILVKRPSCPKCCRPVRVCWCHYLPTVPVEVSAKVYILQHPFEESRPLKTAPMLYHGLAPGLCHIIKGKKFPEHRFPELAKVLQDPNTILLYPGPDAVDITDLPPVGERRNYNLILLDGTWAQAKNLYAANKLITCPKKVQINHSHKSKYVIRTQPNDWSLSTLETAALALSILDQKPHIFDILTKPLTALCDFQLSHGAVQHNSKEFKIENGLWEKTLSKKALKKLEQEKNDNSGVT